MAKALEGKSYKNTIYTPCVCNRNNSSIGGLQGYHESEALRNVLGISRKNVTHEEKKGPSCEWKYFLGGN